MVYTECTEMAAVSRHQPCKNRTALQLHHLGGYSKRAVKSYSHSFRVTWQERSESAWERRIMLYKNNQHLYALMPFPHTTEDPKLLTKIWIHASRYIIIDTDGKEETGKSQMWRGQDITDIFYNQSELWLFETDMAVVMQCLISYEFSASLALQNKGLSSSESKDKQIAIFKPFDNTKSKHIFFFF